MNLKLSYIYHSGYAIEAKDFTIIIDYYKDSADNPEDGIVHKELLNKKGKLYVLSTHSHSDHFNPEILRWKDKKKDIQYIFSKDILDNQKAAAEHAIYLDKLDDYKDDSLIIEAFGSTDLGVSFIIHIKDKTLFHAGDLNNWHWNEESTEDEIREAEAFYKRELDLLAANVKYIDFAMFPVDPRLGKDYMKGAQQFISAIKTKHLAPMHFGEAYDKAAAFAEYASSKGTKAIQWRRRGEFIEL
ncbi:MBL fold metallo-hydrolase [Prevotella sp. 10(H)]|uniref:MBL fold metallo-hydrolase n=1 Tax=Prevotella sp. 10(H) TaxID=1158294 RepID=UPI0004A7157E|nr:MBL fold metallo-hydrolase [Prevotella sp. 10(H)]